MTLPIPLPVAQAVADVDTPLQAVRVLVVEADGLLRHAVAMWLRRLGHDVLTASCGSLGLELARREQPDMIMLDLDLPDVDGCAAARWLVAQAETRHIPIVATAGRDRPGEAERALSAGCRAYRLKPLDGRAFADMVADAVALCRTPD